MDSLGIVVVTSAGTPVKLSATEVRATRVWLQPMRALGATTVEHTPNTGTLYLMNSSTAKGASSTNIIAVVPSEANTLPLPAAAPQGYDLSKLWLDAVNNGDGALICYA